MFSSDIVNREFAVVRKGYDPTEVRAFLAELTDAPDAEADRSAADAHGAQLISIAETVANETRAKAEAYAADVRATADLALAEAQVLLAENTAEAATLATEAEQEAERLRAEAEAAAAARLAAAEEHARVRSAEILDEAKARLQKLLAAEADVHVRLAAALSSTVSPGSQPHQREDEALLDLAFAEFFTSDFEHDESRAWILSDHAG